MEVIHERVAGLDVHKDSVVAGVRLMCGGKAKRECRTFETTTVGLEALRDWLTSSECTVVAMEATGVYWMPVWKIRDEGPLLASIPGVSRLSALTILRLSLRWSRRVVRLASLGLR